MTIASKGSFGIGTNTANNQTLTTHTSATTVAAVGDLVVLIIALDNNGTTDVDQGSVVTVTGGSNTWNKAAEFSNGQGAAQAGTTCAIWWTQVTTQINLSVSHTIDFLDAGAASFDESSSTGWVFTTGGTIAVVETPATNATDGADAPSLNLTTANEARLRVRGIAIESQDASQMTATDGTWTLFTNSTSAAVATAQSVRGEFKISTGTGDASNPTLAVNGDNASIYVAFKETTAHVGEATFAGAGSLSALANRSPIGAIIPGAAGIVYTPESLIHFEGTDGSQIFTDERGHAWAASGAELDTAQQKFGSSAGLFTRANADRLTGDGSADFAFGTGDFTVDLWVRFTAGVIGSAQECTFYDARPAATDGAYLNFHKGTADKIRVYVNTTVQITGTTTVIANTWYHVAVSRSAGTTRLFVDGNFEGSFADGTNYLNPASRPLIGNNRDLVTTFAHDGWIDEFRVLMGMSASVGNSFRVATGPYANGLKLFQNMAAQERLGGAGSFSINVIQKHAERAILSGAGSFSADATIPAIIYVGEARFAGAGNLSAQIVDIKFGEARFAGTGSLSAYARQIHTSRAIFDGAGSFSANVTQVSGSASRAIVSWAQVRFAEGGAVAHQGYATFNGSGNLSVNATLKEAAQARFAGTGALQVDAQNTKTAEARFAGIGSLSANVIGRLAIQATFAGAGNLSVDARNSKAIEATFTGTGSLSANATARLLAYATFQGSGNLSVEATIAGAATQHSGNATFNGAGNFSVNVLQVHSSQIRFNGAGNLSINVLQVHVQGAIFNGLGNLRVEVQNSKQAEARFAGAGSLSVLAQITMPVFATFQGAGNLSANVTARFLAYATFNGTGNLSVEATKGGTKSGEVTWSGAGNLSANVLQQHAGYALFTGAGGLSINVLQIHSSHAIFSGSGNLSVDTTQQNVIKQGEARFEGAGNFRVNVTARYAAEVRFTGTGNLLCSVVQKDAAQAQCAGAGGMSCNVIQRHAIQARFNGVGSLQADSTAFGVGAIYATFHGQGGMFANVTVIGPRHVQSTRPVISGAVRNNTAQGGRNNLPRGTRRNAA